MNLRQRQEKIVKNVNAASRNEARILLATFFLLVILILAVGASLSFGAVAITPAQLWLAVWRRGEQLYQTILWDLRLPRTVAAILVGAALGMSGALLQGMLRNGLADPFLLGISAGAGLVAIAMFSLGMFIAWVPLAAWVGVY